MHCICMCYTIVDHVNKSTISALVRLTISYSLLVANMIRALILNFKQLNILIYCPILIPLVAITVNYINFYTFVNYK